MKSGNSSVFARMVRAGVLGVATMTSAGLLASGCLDRPVSPSTPNTTNVFVDQIKQTTVDKIDLLFMIDNSISMADKQAFLAEAVPQLVDRLINPAIDPVTNKPEFNPVKNIHIGVITSSIGGHGGDVCSETGSGFNATQNDKAHLVPSVRTGLTSFNNLGFLWWDPDLKFGGETNAGTLITNFQAHVSAAGEQGCGYEASLEAWYRFLIDPEPPLNVTLDAPSGQVFVDGIDDALVQQRKDFVRADSLLSIIMLTDENDCSIADVGQNWIAAQASSGGGAFHLPRGTTACDSDPNGVCCRSCQSIESAGPPAGCGALDADSNCALGGHDDASDHLNLRCWNQRKRFGIDFLHPTRRYVDGLKNQQVPDRANNLVPNPLYTDYTGEGKSRDSSLVFLATIVGVPWQDIATDESLTGPGLEYLTATEIQNQGRWDWLVPTCAAPGAGGICDQWNLADQPDDPLMIESIAPRTGTNPATNQALVDPNGGVFSPAGVPNGHEFNIPINNDLQYACIFELPTPRDCANNPTGSGCDCDTDSDPANAKSPLCQQGDGSYSTNQRFAKGYPGTRHLEVAKDYGPNSIVASICPKSTNQGDPAYGYNPAVNAIIERLKEALNVKCINRPVSVKPDGTVQCAIIEVSNSLNGCNCDPAKNRSEIDPVLAGPVLKQLGQTGQCGANNPNGITCDPVNFCMCQINPAVDSYQCKTVQNVTDPAVIGWCYVDPSQEPDPAIAAASAALVEDCNPKRLLRFLGAETPKPGSTTFIACLGAPVSAAAGPDGG